MTDNTRKEVIKSIVYGKTAEEIAEIYSITVDEVDTYADEISKTGTGINIPTTDGSNTLAVNTTIQPSDMIIQSIS